MSDLNNHYFPLKKMSRRQHKISKNSWIIQDILTSIKNKNKLYAKYLKNKSLEVLSKYKKYRNKLTHVKETAKHSCFKYLFQNAKKATDTWKHINELLKKTKPKSTLPEK